MDPNDLYSVRQLFVLGAYKAFTDLPLPDDTAEDQLAILLYRVRAYIALEEIDKALAVFPASNTGLAARAARALALYIKGTDKETHLEELRDLCIEIEGEDVEGDEFEKGMVRVLAGTAFAREGELEEALETLGAGSNHQNLEATALICYVYLLIARPDLARKEFERAHKSSWATDDLLLQHIEATIGIITGKDSYSNPHSYFNEQLQNPSLPSNRETLTARGMTKLLRGEYLSAGSDFEEANLLSVKVESLIGAMLSASLTKGKQAEADLLWERIKKEYPSHPLVHDMAVKSDEFDAALADFTIPPPVSTSA